MRPLTWDNVIEEIEDIGKRYRDRWTSNCAPAFGHLLKIEYWEHAAGADLRHWAREIGRFRTAMARTLQDNPGLKGQYEAIVRAGVEGRSLRRAARPCWLRERCREPHVGLGP